MDIVGDSVVDISVVFSRSVTVVISNSVAVNGSVVVSRSVITNGSVEINCSMVISDLQLVVHFC